MVLLQATQNACAGKGAMETQSPASIFLATGSLCMVLESRGPILGICGKPLEVDFILLDQEQAVPSPGLRVHLVLSSTSLLFIVGPSPWGSESHSTGASLAYRAVTH